MQTSALAHMIGVPFKDKGRDPSGWDCWGCVRYGLRHLFGIDVPSYLEAYATSTDRREIAAVIAQESSVWPSVPLGQARAGDVLILRLKGRPWHAGLVLDPPWFLHADVEAGTVRERWDGLLWRDRVIGLYRPPALREVGAC